MTGEMAIETRDLTRHFGDLVAVYHLSMQVPKGCIYGFLGPNGCGTSSVLNVINGFYHPRAGDVWCHGETRGPLRPHQIAKQGIARTFQNIALFNGMSTLDNIMTGRLTRMHRNIFWQALWKGPAEQIGRAHV